MNLQSARELHLEIEKNISDHIADSDLRRPQHISRDEGIQNIIDGVLINAEASVRERVSEEYSGFGPLKNLIRDDSISEILINRSTEIWFEKNGSLQKCEDEFLSEVSFVRILNKICDEAKTHISLERPYASAKWRNFRLQVIGKEICPSSSVVSLRKHPTNSWTLNRLFDSDWADLNQIDFLRKIIHAKSNILIVGPTGSGKTSVLNALIRETPAHERIVVIEDTAEIDLQSGACVRMVTRSDPFSSLPAIDQSELLKQSLRLRPDRIVMGEIRGSEAKDLILALSTGHSGSLSTLHASNPHQALIRLEMLVQLGAPYWNLQAVRKMIQLGLDYIVLVEKDLNGRRKLKGIFKLVALEETGFLIEPALPFHSS